MKLIKANWFKISILLVISLFGILITVALFNDNNESIPEVIDPNIENTDTFSITEGNVLNLELKIDWDKNSYSYNYSLIGNCNIYSNYYYGSSGNYYLENYLLNDEINSGFYDLEETHDSNVYSSFVFLDDGNSSVSDDDYYIDLDNDGELEVDGSETFYESIRIDWQSEIVTMNGYVIYPE